MNKLKFLRRFFCKYFLRQKSTEINKDMKHIILIDNIQQLSDEDMNILYNAAELPSAVDLPVVIESTVNLPIEFPSAVNLPEIIESTVNLPIEFSSAVNLTEILTKYDCDETLKVNSGMLKALLSKGPQDKYMTDNTHYLFDSRSQFLTGRYQTSYQKIFTTKIKKTKSDHRYINNEWTKLKDTHYLSYKINKQCDLINMVDIVLHNPNNKSINSMIIKIEIEVGGQCLDYLSSSDIETQIKTNNAIYNRKITNINGKSFIPLGMAPFHYNNLISPSATNHDISINVWFTNDYNHNENDVEFYGNIYYLEQPERIKLTNNYEFVTTQNQYSSDTIQNGINTLKLNFNHPMYLIYFWGFDKSKVTNIKLLLDDSVYYDGTLEALEHKKYCRNIDVDPVFMFFSLNLGKTQCNINFSRIDNPKLVITTTQTESSTINIVGFNMAPLKYSNGMYGLTFSK